MRDQFAGRADDEYAWPLALVRQYPFDAGDREGGSLSGAGLSQSEDIAAGQSGWDRFGLDRSWARVSAFEDRFRQRGREVQISEIAEGF